MFDVFSGATAKTSDVLTAIDSSISMQAKYNIVAINMSVGDGSSNPSQCTASVYKSAVTNAARPASRSWAAAGNSGSKSGLGNPACTPGIVSVGAVYDASYGAIEWDAMADSGGVCTDNASAPDLVTCFSQSAAYLTLFWRRAPSSTPRIPPSSNPAPPKPRRISPARSRCYARCIPPSR